MVNFKFCHSVILITFLTCVNTPLMAVSFNCKKAATAVEKSICNYAELSELDSEMAKAYKSLAAVLPKAEASVLKKDQQQWLGERDEAFHTCAREKSEDCLVYEYAVRISVLGTPKNAGFNCKKAGTPVEKKICASRLLRHADGQLTELYKPRREDFKDSQRDWLKERDVRLADKMCDLLCAWNFYQDRIRFFVHQNF